MNILDNTYDIKKYKDALIRNWKQHCERGKEFNMIRTDDDVDVLDSFILKDKHFSNFISSFGTLEFIFHKNTHFFKKGKKHSIIKLYEYSLKLRHEHVKIYDITKKEESIFDKLLTIPNLLGDKYTLKKHVTDFGIVENDICTTYLKIDIYLLIFNNIIILLPKKVGLDLIEYERECRRKDDLVEIYNDSTFIPFDEYSDFIKWRKELKLKENEDLSIMEVNSKNNLKKL
jgi:hypothetical protein